MTILRAIATVCFIIRRNKMSVIHLETKDYKKEVENCELPVLIDFYAPWCGPCLMMADAVESLANDLSDKVKVCKVNVDEEEELAIKFFAESIPLFVLIKNGKVVAKTVGYQPLESLKHFVEEKI